MNTERALVSAGAQPTRLGSENHQQEIVLLWRQCDMPVTARIGKCCAPESEGGGRRIPWFSEITDICSFQKPPSNQAHPLCHLKFSSVFLNSQAERAKEKEE